MQQLYYEKSRISFRVDWSGLTLHVGCIRRSEVNTQLEEEDNSPGNRDPGTTIHVQAKSVILARAIPHT